MLTKHDYYLLDQHFRVRLASGSINGTPPNTVPLFEKLETAPPRRQGRPRTRTESERALHKPHGWIA